MPGYHVDEIGCHALRAGAWIDHVHVVCELSRTVTIAALVEHVKVETSKSEKNSTHGSSLFSWQSGYGAFSVSPSNRPAVVDDVENQSSHHAHRTFQDEFRE
jgi:putative transposase